MAAPALEFNGSDKSGISKQKNKSLYSWVVGPGTDSLWIMKTYVLTRIAVFLKITIEAQERLLFLTPGETKKPRTSQISQIKPNQVWLEKVESRLSGWCLRELLPKFQNLKSGVRSILKRAAMFTVVPGTSADLSERSSTETGESAAE